MPFPTIKVFSVMLNEGQAQLLRSMCKTVAKERPDSIFANDVNILIAKFEGLLTEGSSDDTL